VLIELTDVTKHYTLPDGRTTLPVLKGVTLEVSPGDTIAVTGPSGSGKSTLLNIMGALDFPSSGTAKLEGRVLAGLSDGELAQVRNTCVGFVFQMHHLLPQCTALENVLVPTIPAFANKRKNAASSANPAAGPAAGPLRAPKHDTRVSLERARALLERVGLGGRMDHMPGSLSGGECQRVAVARALINAPRLILADEPTGSLDRASAEGLIELLVEINRENATSLVVVTHSGELAGRMKRAFALRDGKLVRSRPEP
jgi:predicted ABC-type transport system involved in lysophospholipase L1 biosynthesis ATPase subunit